MMRIEHIGFLVNVGYITNLTFGKTFSALLTKALSKVQNCLTSELVPNVRHPQNPHLVGNIQASVRCITKASHTKLEQLITHTKIMQQILQLKLPAFINIDVKEITFVLAAKLYEDGKLSLGQAAELSGVSKRTLMELLSNYGVSIFNYDAIEIERDLKNA